MIPITLTLQGVNSYQEPQTIDFTELMQDKIFGIFGPVGSGKSTIPETIAYVLYGRFDKMGKQDLINYNLMNLSSNTLLIKFIFETSSSEKFRFEVKGKRNGKDFNDVKLERSRYRWVNEIWIPDENLNAEEILGLSYDNFKRTIIIPQNKFMEFINLQDSERTLMLKEIFNLSKFDLSENTNALINVSNQKLENIKGKLDELKEVNQEEINIKTTEKETKSKERETIKQKIVKISNDLNILNNLKKIFDDLANAKKTFDELDYHREKFDFEETELKKFEICVINFKALLDDKKSISKKLLSNTSELNNNKEKLNLLKSDLNLLQSKFSQLKSDYDRSETIKSEIEELVKMKTIKDNKDKIFMLESGLNRHIKTIHDLTVEIEKITQQILAGQKLIAQKELELTDLNQLYKVKEWYIEKENLNISQDEIKKSLEEKEVEIKELEIQKNSIFEDTKIKDLKLEFFENPNDTIRHMNLKIQKYKETINKLRIDKEEHAIRAKLDSYSRALIEGKPCPVCGSIHHPDPIKIENLQSEIDRLNGRIKDGEELTELLRVVNEKFSNITNQIEISIKDKDDLIKNLNVKIKSFETHKQKFTWEKFKTYDQAGINKEIEKNTILENEIKNLRRELEVLAKLKDEISLKKELMTNDIMMTRNDIASLNASTETLLAQISIIDVSEFENIAILELEDLIISKNHHLSKLIQDYESTEKKIISLNDNEKEYRYIISNIEKNIQDLDTDKNENQSLIRDNLLKFNIGSEEEVSNTLSKNIDIENQRSRLEKYKTEYEIAKAKLADLQAQTEGISFDNSLFEHLNIELSKESEGLEKINEEIGALEGKIKDWEIKLENKTNLQNDQKKLDIRIENLNTLRNLFKANGFVAFISKLRLQELVNYANFRYSKLTRGIYKLELTQSNNFDVIDYLNEGKRRSIKSLSGGQKFQASLSLALALAGIVQGQNKASQNFFFLDEGFGTQDNESLNLVFDTITSLRQENRIVGLISHVGELKENITKYLDIVNDPVVGSKIWKSWELG